MGMGAWDPGAVMDDLEDATCVFSVSYRNRLEASLCGSSFRLVRVLTE